MTDAHHLSSFFDRKAAKEFEFNDAALMQIDPGQFFQCFMKSEQIHFRLLGKLSGAGNRESLLI